MQTVQPIRDRAKIEAMKKILRASTLRNELLFVLGINTGLRISDILALNIADVSTVDRLELREKKTNKKRIRNEPLPLLKKHAD
jgi:integrase